MSEVLVRCETVSKTFCRDLKRSLWYGVRDVASEMLLRDGKSVPKSSADVTLRKGEFWANRDISFELKRGECLGLIGRNGAGKTTLLKMLNGLIKPDTGRIEMRGRVGALIALGAGFNPILTGRENVLVNGSVLGLSRRQIRDKFDEIVEFAELADFIDMPLRNYSSGMSVRLGFACSVLMSNPDVLLLDEVLAVGDISFRARCYERISRILSGTAVIFVSHSLPQLSRLSTRAIHLAQGHTLKLGSPGEVIQHYLSTATPNLRSNHIQTGDLKINSLRINNHPIDLEQGVRVDYGSSIRFVLLLECSQAVEPIHVNISFENLSGDLVAQFCSEFSPTPKLGPFMTGSHSITMALDRITLNPGLYRLHITILNASNPAQHLAWITNMGMLHVVGSKVGNAPQQFAGKITVTTASPSE